MCQPRIFGTQHLVPLQRLSKPIRKQHRILQAQFHAWQALLPGHAGGGEVPLGPLVQCRFAMTIARVCACVCVCVWVSMH